MSIRPICLCLSDAATVAVAGALPQPLAPMDALLLAWLALNGATPRDRMARLLWPDSPADGARTALRQRLFRLRRQVGLDLVTGQLQLALAAGLTHDLADALTLLGSFDLATNTELGAWLQAERGQRRELARADLMQRIDALDASGDFGAGVQVARSLITLDPLREDAHRCLMRLLYLAGDRAAALRAFDDCEQRLKHEIGTRPSPETLALLETIDAAERAAWPGPTTPRALPTALMRPPRLVGRDPELLQLQGVLQAGQRAVIVGEAGVGKSRLLQALSEAWSRPVALAGNPPPAFTANLLLAAGRPGDTLVPYATLGRALRALQVLRPQALLAAQADHLAPVLPELASAAPALAQAPDALRKAVAAVLREALSALGGVVLDDLHFADDATLQMLPELIEASAAAPNHAWLLCLRPPADGSAAARLLAQLTQAATWQTVQVAPLDGNALAEMVDSLALPGVSGALLAPLLHARSGGNPLFALETLKLAWTEGHALADGVLPRPRNVGQLIDAALAALSPSAFQLARVAAIAGVDFSVGLAEVVLQQSALAMADAWAELEGRQVLRGAAFAHDLMHEAVLAGIPAVLARHAHGQVAAWLEQRGGEPGRIAAHWEAAGLRERALPSLRAAAARAHAALREPERVAFLLRGADIAEASGQPDQAFDLVAQAVASHMNTMRDADGLPLLDRLDALVATPRQAAVAAGNRAWYRTTLGDWAGAIEAGELALQRCAVVAQNAARWPPLSRDQADADADANGANSAADADADTDAHAEADAELQALVSQRLGTALAMAGRFDEALARLRAAEAWVDGNASSATAAEFHGNVATVLDNLGHPADARAHHERVIEVTRNLRDHAFLATAHANLAVSRLNAGDVAAAQTQLGLAQQLISGYDLKGASAGFIAALQAQAARSMGDYTAALQWCDTAQDLVANANPVWLPVVWMHRAQCLLDLAQTARAQNALAQCDLAAMPPRLRARHALLIGRLHLATGQDAAGNFEAALQAAPEPGWPELRLNVRLERAQVLGNEQAVAELLSVEQRARQLGLQGVELAAQLRLAQAAAAADVALAAAQRALSADPAIEPNGLYRGERWLGPAQALASAGQAMAALALVQAGWAWVQHCAEGLPEPLRDGFLNRQGVNQGLQRLLSRLPESGDRR